MCTLAKQKCTLTITYIRTQSLHEAEDMHLRHASLVDMFDTHITPTHGPCLAGSNIIKLWFNNKTVLSKNLLITLSVVIIQNSCHLWRL